MIVVATKRPEVVIWAPLFIGIGIHPLTLAATGALPAGLMRDVPAIVTAVACLSMKECIENRPSCLFRLRLLIANCRQQRELASANSLFCHRAAAAAVACISFLLSSHQSPGAGLYCQPAVSRCT